MKKEAECFECSKEVNSQLMESIKIIKRICGENKIPFFVGVAIKEDSIDTEYYSEILSPTVLGRTLSNDKITKMINVINGFDTVYPRKMTDIDAGMLVQG